MNTVFTGDVLIVEDNFIIAMDVDELLLELGASAVHIATNCQDAMDVMSRVSLTSAILDFHIDDGTSESVADALVAASVPFIFATGYSDDDIIPERYQKFPILKKPYSRDDLIEIFQAVDRDQS